MPTSGSTDWTLNRNQVITAALRKLAVLPSGGTPSTAQISDASDALNALIKAFHADGMPLWAITSTSFTTVSGTSSYTIGVGQTIDTPYPLKLLQAFRTESGGVNTPMNVYNRYDFNELPQTDTSGVPITLYYQPLNGTGVIKLWPEPEDSTTTITIHYQRPYEDMDNASDAFDFPSSWILALTYYLAWTLAPEYGIPPADRNILSQEARVFKEEALSQGSEEGSLFIKPDWAGNYRKY